MKKSTTLFLSILFLMVAIACSDEEEPDYFSVRGQIAAGETVTADELPDIEIMMGLLSDTVDIETITTKTSVEFQSVMKSPVDVDGSFVFNDLDYGNYILMPEPGFIFVPDTFCLVTIDGASVKQYLRAVERISPDNTLW